MRPPPRTFVGATVVLTGAAGGIGEQMTLQLAAEGAATLVLLDRDEDRLLQVAQAVRTRTPEATVDPHPVDLGDHAALDDAARRIRAAHPRIDLLVNNAGVSMFGRFSEMTLEDFTWLTDINLRAPVALTHHLLPALRAADGAHIVNVSSIFGLIAPPGQSAYATSKFGLRGFSETLRVELAAEGIGVTTVHPGGIRTRIATDGRMAARADTDAFARHQRRAAKALRMPADRAARIILDGARRRRARVLVGADAKLLQWIPRLAPSRMGEILARGTR